MRGPPTAAKSGPCSLQLEMARAQQQRPNAAKQKQQQQQIYIYIYIYIQKLIFSHHLYCYSLCLRRHHPSLGLLKTDIFLLISIVLSHSSLSLLIFFTHTGFLRVPELARNTPASKLLLLAPHPA